MTTRTSKRTLIDVTLGGGTPRGHDTQPATTGDDSYSKWYVVGANDAEVQAHNALIRDADNAAYNAARYAGGYVQHDWDGENGRLGACSLPPDSVRRIAAEDAIATANRLREARPIPEPSPLRRHEDALRDLPTIAYIKEWGKQWKAARDVTRTIERRAASRARRSGVNLNVKE